MKKRNLKEKIVLTAVIFSVLALFAVTHTLTAEKIKVKEEPTTIQIIVKAVTTTEATTVEQTPTNSPKKGTLGVFKITGYTPSCEHCCGKSDGITASGAKAVTGKTAAMNRADMRALGIEYGDKIYIDGIGERVVQDTGCGKGVIDVACENHEECYKVTGFYQVEF